MTRQALAALAVGMALLTAGCASTSSPSGHTASSPPSAQTTPPTVTGTGVVSRDEPGCTTATQSAPALPATAVAMTTVTPSAASYRGAVAPFGVAISGHWAFAALGRELGVLRLSPGHAARLVRTVALPMEALGAALAPDGRFLLLAGGPGAFVVSVQAAEQGHGKAVLGELSAPAGLRGGAIEVAVSNNSRYAFVSMEDSEQIAVFDLAKALADGFGKGAYVGAVPAQIAPVGLAVSPDGGWLYSTSEAEDTAEIQDSTSAGGTAVGALEVISIPRAESDPAKAVVAMVAAGCNPVRVITSADGAIIWVTARESDALLAFSAAKLRTDPSRALLADVQVGEAPVGLALAKDGSLVVIADSDRFNATGHGASLAVVSTADALAGRPALVGYLPAGQFPRDMAASQGGGTLLVANFASAQLETVNGAALP